MGKSAPKAPDPYKTAATQTASNISTAQAQQMMNMVNQVGPWGSTTYSPTGSTQFTDAFGKTHTIPTYTQTTSYSPEQQGIFDRTTEAQTNLADLAVQQSDFMKDYLANPFEFNNQDAADWAYDLASSRILPQQQQNTEALRSQLINSGLRPGTAAYEREMTRLTQNQGDQLNQLVLTGRKQAFDEAMATRNQPINEISALLSGTQIQSPTTGYVGTPSSSVAGVDYTGLVNNKYQADMANYQSKMGGLFGLAGTLGSAAIMASDRRLKTSIRKIGEYADGLGCYVWKYLGSDQDHEGVMADEVARLRPWALGPTVAGYATVNYGAL